MKKLLLISVLAVFVCTDVMAQEVQEAPVSPVVTAEGTQIAASGYGQPRLRRRDRIQVRLGHELRFGAGAYSIPGMGYYYRYDPANRYYSSSLHGFNLSKSYVGPLYYTGTYSLGYSYRFNRVIGFGLTVSYSGRHGKCYDSFDKSVLGNSGADFITFMPMLRVHWLNGKLYSLYSAVGIGITVEQEYEKSFRRNYSFTDTMLTGQFTPLGITVGRRLFGFAEVGVGAQGCLICGIGYKF